LRLTTELRAAGIPTACYPEAVKLPKQMKYADRMGIRWVVLRGPDEEAQDLVTVKDLSNRTQQTFSRDGWESKVSELLG
ncbi:MAG TPA: His/Gly/Thr/Pro-type tRNA ligase C-terminal domain-containing protein, partial [Anaerolineaceae bacterium]|nr:His/Gly/Thr/Pro-type tRNA ligase C-terminal domain-containing protein [Anaerolineaceae bacterium]